MPSFKGVFIIQEEEEKEDREKILIFSCHIRWPKKWPYQASIAICRQEDVMLRIMPIKLVSDYMGMPKFLRCNCKTKCGACMVCHTEGVHASGKVVYPGKLQHLHIHYRICM